MNVDHQGGSIIAFRDSFATRNAPGHEVPKPIDTELCRDRERAERAAAEKAASLEARRVHQELAEAFAALVERSEEG